ncbi:MAG: hypothetical protein Q8S73_34195 [Deltaproteobacteria bacterium]|nr:hypothetical protein [Deltaproteobacteria bacterium]
MKERPILFSAPMVRALLNGTKSQTRRVVKQTLERLGDGDWYAFDHKGINYRVNARHTTVAAWAHLLQFCPYGQPGDRLWVRETWTQEWMRPRQGAEVFYRADGEVAPEFEPWIPSIHMFRWASRILLEIVSVRVERLQDISEADALAEGVTVTPCKPSQAERMGRHAFRSLWEDINGNTPAEWAANPWVWVVEFKQVILDTSK